MRRKHGRVNHWTLPCPSHVSARERWGDAPRSNATHESRRDLVRHAVEPVARRDGDGNLCRKGDDGDDKGRQGEQDGDDARLLQGKEARRLGAKVPRGEDERQHAQEGEDGGWCWGLVSVSFLRAGLDPARGRRGREGRTDDVDPVDRGRARADDQDAVAVGRIEAEDRRVALDSGLESAGRQAGESQSKGRREAVSYTHLTLPTIYSV